MHIVGTSVIFGTMYGHIVKGVSYSTAFFSQVNVFIIGFSIYMLTVGISFFGYVLPMTQIGYWGLGVISGIIASIPIVGNIICIWFWGGEYISSASLSKIFSLHVFLPIIGLALILCHFIALHNAASSDALYKKGKSSIEATNFLCFALYRDASLSIIAFFFLIYNIFISPYFIFHEENFQYFDSLKTSDKVIPEWFLLYLFSIIKAIPSKLIGLAILLVLIFGLLLYFIGAFSHEYARMSRIHSFTCFFTLLVLLSFLAQVVLLVFPLLELLLIYILFLFLFILINVF